MMINLKDIEKIDTKKMFKIYDRWPEIAKISWNSEIKLMNFFEINHIVFAGMGGSGSLGDIFSSILSETKIHVTVNKGYNLPKTVDEKTIVIVTSISGNTDETLTVLKKAEEKNCKLIAFTSNGKMKEYCIKNKIDFREISMEHSPRASLIKFFYCMIKVLKPILPIIDKDIEKSIVDLEKTRVNISSSNLTTSNQSLQLAIWIKQIPLIYFPSGLNAASIRFKNSLQENSKSHAIAEDIIEACHNGIMAWEKISNVQPIIIRGNNDHFKTHERWEILKQYFSDKGIEYKEIISEQENIISKIINLIYLLDYTSIYVSIISKIDPTSVDSINYVKSRCTKQ